MNTPMTPEPRKPLRTSDLAAAGAPRTARDDNRDEGDSQRQSPAATPTAPPAARKTAPTPERAQERAQETPKQERLEALFPEDATARYRTRWAEVQSGFVDDPRRAVAEGDELVAEVMQSLAESFARERRGLEEELSRTGEASTEALRVGLRRYHSFFDRLLSL